jgi:hypothetical protein
LWIAFSEEDMFKTEGGRPDLWRNRSFLSQFNLTSTYDYASSDLPFNLWRFHFFGPCTANVYFAPPPEFSDAFTIYEAEIINNDQTDDQTDNPSSLVSYISRNCRVQRDAWVRRLMSILPVASLGKCLRNTAWPFRKASYPYWQEKVLVLRRYPFTLAIEGSDTPGKSGLVSEKLFDAFAAGTVPIYWGAPRHVVERFAPSPESFIHVDDFPEGVEQLASYLKSLARNPAEYYAKHHAWRNAMSEPVVNSNGGRNNDAQRTEGFLPRFCELLDTNINTLACRMCEKVSAHRDKVLAEEGASHFTPASERNDEEQHDDKPKNDSELTPVLVLGIKSAVGDRALRDAIRSSWVTPLAAANGVHDGPSGRGDRFDITFLIIGDGPNGEVTDANHIRALREEAEKSSVPLLVTAMHASGNSNLRVGAAGPVLNFARDLVQRGIVSADTLSDELVDSAADPASAVYIVICKATVVPHIDNILWEFLGGTIGAEGTVRTPQPRRRKRLYMGHVEEYATGKAQPITSGALGVSSEGKIDVEHWPPYAQSDMYVLSSDVMAWLGSDAARTLQQVEPVGVVAARLGDSVGESPILASWLLMIQVHAQHGGTGCGVNGQDAVWLDPFGRVVRADAPASDCGTSAERTTTKFATTGFNTAGDMLKYWAFEEERRLKC